MDDNDNLYSDTSADNYEDFLSLDKPISDSDLLSGVISESTILVPNTNIIKSEDEFTSNTIDLVGVPSSITPTTRSLLTRQRKSMPDWWSDWMQEQLGGDMDNENETDPWHLELRDTIELRLGRAIWSKKSPQEIQRAMKKMLSAKAMRIPPVVAQVITAVYIEKTHRSVKEYKKEDEIACIEFRKWLVEQKKKAAKNKDPLLAAKIELSKVWLMRRPGTALYSRPMRPRAAVPHKKSKTPLQYPFSPKPLTLTVLDQVFTFKGVTKLDANTIQFDDGSKSGSGSGARPVSGPNGAASTNKFGSAISPPSVIMTMSMANWNKPLHELPLSELYQEDDYALLDGDDGDKGDDSDVKRVKSLFMVDDVEMFVPTYTMSDEDYFVVL